MQIERLLKKSIIKHCFLGRIIILYGPRRVGKTTLVKDIQKASKKKSIYLNCEEPDVNQALTSKNSQELKKYLGDNELIIFDEAQTILNIGRTLKLLVDNYPDIQIIATGSSSFDLANKIKEPLTGRKWEFFLYPLSVLELLETSSKIDINRQVNVLLKYGLYPDIYNADFIMAESKLDELSYSYLFKDILAFENIKNPELLKKLLQALAYQLGQEVSYTELANLLNVDQETIQRYLILLEKAFVIFRLPPLSRNLRKELGKKRKIYFYDLGIRNSIINNFNDMTLRPDRGGLWENFCILERKKYLDYNNIKVNQYFWRTYDQKEIDYIEERNNTFEAFEFKYGQAKKSKNYTDFLNAYQNSKITIINPENWLEELINIK